MIRMPTENLNLRGFGLHGVGLAVAAVVAFTFYRGIYAPLHGELAERSARIEKVDALTAHGGRIARTHSDVLARLHALERSVTATRARIPADVSSGKFVDNTTQLAAALGLELQQCQADPPQRYDSYATIDVTCRVQGAYDSIRGYLAAVDQLPQISRIRRLELGRDAGTGAYPLQVTFQLYYQVDPLDKDSQGGSL